jgi:anti-sigma B factor antagonist
LLCASGRTLRIEFDRDKQPARDSGREDPPLPTRFGRTKQRRQRPARRPFGRYTEEISAATSNPLEPPFRVRREDDGDVAVVAVEGEVDVATAPKLRNELDSIPAESNVVVDLCETLFMDSTGVSVLLAAHSALNQGIRIACQPAGPVSRLFDMTLAGKHLRVYESRADALADL